MKIRLLSLYCTVFFVTLPTRGNDVVPGFEDPFALKKIEYSFFQRYSIHPTRLSDFANYLNKEGPDVILGEKGSNSAVVGLFLGCKHYDSLIMDQDNYPSGESPIFCFQRNGLSHYLVALGHENDRITSVASSFVQQEFNEWIKDSSHLIPPDSPRLVDIYSYIVDQVQKKSSIPMEEITEDSVVFDMKKRARGIDSFIRYPGDCFERADQLINCIVMHCKEDGNKWGVVAGVPTKVKYLSSHPYGILDNQLMIFFSFCPDTFDYKKEEWVSGMPSIRVYTNQCFNDPDINQSPTAQNYLLCREEVILPETNDGSIPLLNNYWHDWIQE